MTTSLNIEWASSYIPTTQRKKLLASLTEVYQGLGYQPYSPFAGGSGSPMGKTDWVRTFLSPKQDGWVRLIGYSDHQVLEAVAAALDLTIIHAWITKTEGHVELIGQKPWGDFLREGITQAQFEAPPTSASPSEDSTPMAQFAEQKGVDSRLANQLIQKTTAGFMGRLQQKTGEDATSMQTAAQASMQGFSWSQASAQGVHHQLSCLALPDSWQAPAFADLAAAYAIACQIELTPNAPLLPSDETILDKVPYPLDYTPLYFAR